MDFKIKVRNKFFLLAILTMMPLSAFGFPPDSVGVKEVNGKKFILHKVEPGQNIYRISLRYMHYGIKIDDILHANPEIQNFHIVIDQIVLVPMSAGDTTLQPQSVSENKTEELLRAREALLKAKEEQLKLRQQELQQKENDLNGLQNKIMEVNSQQENIKMVQDTLKEKAISLSEKEKTLEEKEKMITDKIKILDEKEKMLQEKETEQQKNFLVNENSTASVTTNISTQPISENLKIHIVGQGETFYGISRLYGLTMDELCALNDLKSENTALSMGQALIVDKNKLREINRPAQKVDVTSDPRFQHLSDNLQVQAIEDTTSDVNIHTVSKKEIVKPTVVPVTQKGAACYIKYEDASAGKFYALHRSIPKGTIVQVINQMNGKSVYVKIVGMLPNTDDNKKYVIKISEATAQFLQTKDNDFLVEIRYVP